MHRTRSAPLVQLLFLQDRPANLHDQKTQRGDREDVGSLLVGTEHVERVIDSRRPDHGARLLHHALQVQAQRQTKDLPNELILPDNLARPPSTIATVIEVADYEPLQLLPRGTAAVLVQVVPRACRILAIRRRCRQREVVRLS